MVVSIVRKITFNVVLSFFLNKLSETCAKYARNRMDGPTTNPFQPRATTPNAAPARLAFATALPFCFMTSPNAENIPDRDG